MKYCSHCGARVRQEIPNGDNRPRDVCGECGMIHYQNPRVVAGCLPVYDNKVLLCRRAIEPRKGLWTLPGGFLELGETIEQGAIRETFEEAGAEVTVTQLYTLFNVLHVGQLSLFFLAEMDVPVFSAGVESLEVQLFGEQDIPWDELAFTTIRLTLEYYFSDRRRGEFVQRIQDINYNTAKTQTLKAGSA
ncbi:NUDIX hydrolase [Endozoicomonas montiporae]|uniref:NUDIX hydrolase n=1 Tax=Endozoicomonas montiporae TaxID=1027273 RepID=UPI00068A7B25|nr:NUDIX hydrolase [Endozoicomonas montiporae]